MLDREEKWQEIWRKEKTFESEPDGREKFFCTFPYPYVNGLPHVGHLFTMMRVEAFARYHRLQGKNVLFPQGFHATGSPIATAAMRVKEREDKQLEILRDLGVQEEDLAKFEQSEYWIEYFAPKYKEDLQNVGFSIDWRREFTTTSLNPQYDAFIRWQFTKLKEQEYVRQGEHPVVWCPKEETPVSDHARASGEGETPQEFLLVKHKLPDGRFLVSATLRPDTILGVTNIYVNPDTVYAEATVGDETWVLSKQAATNLNEQGTACTITGNVNGIDLIGQSVEEYAGTSVLVLPATFLDEKVGTGLVHSVPSDSADDLIALRDLQRNGEELAKYNLDPEAVKGIEPIPVLVTGDIGDMPAQFYIEKYDVQHQNERKKLEQIRKELYKIGYYGATFNEKYKRFGLAGTPVPDGKDVVQQRLIDEGWAHLYYELTGRVVCRCQTEAIVKIVSDQWFLAYGDPVWKKLAHEALDNMQLFPEQVRSQFEHVLDWLKDWACTREYGLGTRLPWDDRWLIESLSDSTIYMAYYTVSHKLKEVAPEQLTTEFFDALFLGKGSVQKADELRKEFLYWYPLDFRNSGKDLVQNHLSFMLFNHCAIFPKELWPRSIGVNGWVTVNGQKMSKSLGNIIPVRQLLEEYGADATRITILNGGEGLDDPNWDSNFARGMAGKLNHILRQAEEIGSFSDEGSPLDDWFSAKVNDHIRKVTAAMESTSFRTAIQEAFFEMGQTLQWYGQRTSPKRALYEQAFLARLVMLSPFVPHICEEVWERMEQEGLIANAPWPAYRDEEMDVHLDAMESMVLGITEYVRKQQKQGDMVLFLAEDWKRDACRAFDNVVGETRNPKEILATLLKTPLQKHGDELQRLVFFLVKSRSPGHVSSADEERLYLEASREYLEQLCGGRVRVADATVDHPRARAGIPGKPAIGI